MILINVLKKSAMDIYDDLLHLVFFNVICVISMILLPLTLFGLFATVYDIGKGRAIKISHFFTHIKQSWKQALIWGAVNLVVIFLFGISLPFYAEIEATWAFGLEILIIGVFIYWVLIQFISLALYPRLTEPSFVLAQKNAALILAIQPLGVLLLGFLTALILLLTTFSPIVMFLFGLSFLAVYSNRLVEAAIKQNSNAQTKE
ncbi:hypothetical protein QUF64_06720 [Anaerolineales bacterium HSG6]|nr:hypothetical protein [Anaerolineales bacterium HSG6]MDM8531189.1 hypothetical protein [Anaerolineales bacterium HSG25]